MALTLIATNQAVLLSTDFVEADFWSVRPAPLRVGVLSSVQ
jgi:hypothetical protein